MNSSMDPELTQKFERFRSRITAVAEDIIFTVFPKKILALQDVLDAFSEPSSMFNTSQMLPCIDSTVYPAPPQEGERDIKKRKRSDQDDIPNGVISKHNDTEHARFPNRMLANKHIFRVHELLKTEAEELVTLCDQVKLWVNLTMPKIEEFVSRLFLIDMLTNLDFSHMLISGDNFGVQIQEEALSELHRSQECGHNIRDDCRQHHLHRAKICSKIIKYPNVEDYTIAITEHDEKQMFIARQHLSDLRSIYAVLTDILHKNIAKIRAPKNNNGIGLY